MLAARAVVQQVQLAMPAAVHPCYDSAAAMAAACGFVRNWHLWTGNACDSRAVQVSAHAA